MDTAANVTPDMYELRKAYEPLRVVDVVDALDGIGYFNIGLVSPEIRPLWAGMKFWGVAHTLRCVPTNKPMWKLETTDEIVRSHGIWFDKVGRGAFGLGDKIKPGAVVVTDTGGADTVGVWGSLNLLDLVKGGAVGILTNGACRDTGEVIMQRTPIACKNRGRTIIPGRIEAIETQTPIGFGGQQVRPGDIIGCDDDGIVVVPQEVAEVVAVHARGVLIADMKAREKRYAALKMPPDASIDYAAVDAYYAQLGR